MEAKEMKYVLIMAVLIMIMMPGLLTQLFTVALIIGAGYIILKSGILENIISTKQIKKE